MVMSPVGQTWNEFFQQGLNAPDDFLPSAQHKPKPIEKPSEELALAKYLSELQHGSSF